MNELLRDRTCRTPFCDAPIRHPDHLVGGDAGETVIVTGSITTPTTRTPTTTAPPISRTLMNIQFRHRVSH